LYNLNAVLRDVYHISNLEDMIALPSTKPENGGEISIKYDRGKSTMVLSTTKRDVLLAVSHTHTHIYIYTNNQLIAPSS
jgi:neurofibromin 1